MKSDHPLQFCALLCFLAITACGVEAAQTAVAHATQYDIAYHSKETLATADAYQQSQCRLDIHHPVDSPGFATVVWFHGGGLTGGKRRLPDLQEVGLGLVAVGYRLSPGGAFPSFLEDAAAATAWVLENIDSFGGDPARVFISGHSAGGYLAALIGMDARWLAPHGIVPKQLAGVIPVSAQVTTHFHVKQLLGDTGPQLRPLIDEYAPLYHASESLPPICLVVGDRALEFKSRVEENQLLAVTLRNLGHPHVEFYEMGGLDHGTIERGSMIIVQGFIERVLSAQIGGK